MPKALQLTMRALLYILRVALWSGLAIGLIMFAFYFAKDMSNIYIISTDGMQKRAALVLQKDSSIELTDCFTSDFIAKDELLNVGPYEDYFIRDFDYKLKIEWMWALPWNETAKVRASEQIPALDGEMLQEKMPQGATEKVLPPAWKGALYELTLKRAGESKWLISAIKKLEDLPEPTPLPLLTLKPGMEFPTATPRPSVTPTPSATAPATPAATIGDAVVVE